MDDSPVGRPDLYGGDDPGGLAIFFALAVIAYIWADTKWSAWRKAAATTAILLAIAVGFAVPWVTSIFGMALTVLLIVGAIQSARSR